MRHPALPLSLALSLCLLGMVPPDGLRAAEGEAPAAAAIALDGWKGEAEQYSNAVELLPGEDGGKKQLTITVKGGEKDKAAVCRSLSGVKIPAAAVLRLRVANTSQTTVPLTVAFKTGNGWAFHESERTSVKPGTQDVVFDLTTATFKSEATAWKNTGAITDLEQAKELQFCIYNGKEAVALVISDVAVAAKP